MKTTIYLRVAQSNKGKKGVMVDASTKPNYRALLRGSGKNYTDALPTILVSLELDIPDSQFSDARIKLEAKIKEAQECIQIREVSE